MNWLTGFSDYFTNLWRPRKEGDKWWYILQDGKDIFQERKYLDSFNRVPELNAIINLKARSFANGVIKAVNKDGVELPEKVPLCLQTPNWFQGQGEFLRQTKLFHEIYGDEYIYLGFGVGMRDLTGVKTLFSIPPNLIECEYTSSQPFFLSSPTDVKYSLIDGGETIPSEQIIHLNDNRVTVLKANSKTILKGESKQKGLAAAICNIEAAYESRGVILRTRGAQGFVSNAGTDVSGTVPLDPKEKDRLQKEFSNYGTLASQNMMIFTNQALKYQKMGINPSELGLFEETEQGFFKMCDSYGTPIDLFASIKGSTFENQKQAEKGLYLRTIIPEANEWIGAVSKALIPDGSVTLIMDYSHLHIFQEDLKQRGDALTAVTGALSKALLDKAITIEEYKEELSKFGIGQKK